MPPKSVEIQLVPPGDVTFFSSETINIFNNQRLEWSGAQHGGNSDAGSITWNIDVYKYCAGSLPPEDPNFSAKSGSIIFVLVHRGSLYVGKNTYERQLVVWPESSSADGTVQQPSTGSGVQDGDTWKCVDRFHVLRIIELIKPAPDTIDYSEIFPMLKNQAQEFTTFNAKYHEDYALTRAKQTGFTGYNTNGVGFYIQCQSNASGSTLPIKACSVFKTRDPKAFPMKFRFQHVAHLNTGSGSDEYSAYATKEVSISRGF
ncbi:hypothetical protein ONZ45_g798 [Pleurotus djamor]|nr:hypothetical protein ONZ45_g798 [Pleurotus djamor]